MICIVPYVKIKTKFLSVKFVNIFLPIILTYVLSAQMNHLIGLQIRVHIGKLFFFISHRKHMLWVLQRTASMRWIFLAPKTHV